VDSTDLLLRRANEADADDVASVYLASRKAAPMPPLQQTDESVRYWVEHKLQGYDETWVAEVAGRIVGYARLAGDWLDDLYVAPTQARQGIGSALLDVVKSVRPDGFSLWVFEMNAAARAFYAKHGLVELAHTDGAANEEGAPDLRVAWPGTQPLVFLRRLVDELDTELGAVLERRAVLTAAIQAYKPVGGPAGRDLDREREIAERMARFAPRLGAERLQRIIHAVITESLDASEDA